jgi:putative hydrolase of the HAD superfamily
VGIQAVLFDLDNTLFDHQASGRAGLKAFLRHLQATPSADLASSWFEIEQLSYDRFLSKEISFQEQRRERRLRPAEWWSFSTPCRSVI